MMRLIAFAKCQRRAFYALMIAALLSIVPMARASGQPPAAGDSCVVIVVMPAGIYPGQPAGNAATLEDDRFGEDLLGDIIPYVEKNYRVRAGRNQRAMAGLSKGGFQTIRIGIPHMEMFGYLGIFSAGVHPAVEKQLEEQLKKQLDVEMSHPVDTKLNVKW